MSDLKPRPEQMPAESAQELAAALRILFESIGLSMTRYAARVHMDKSVVSRYLSGARVPRWDFIRDLLAESTRAQGQAPPTTEVVRHLRRLHQDALQNGGSPLHKIQLLQEQLAEADREAVKAGERVRLLEAALQDAQQRISVLQVRERELQAARDTQYEARLAELTLHQSHQESWHREREQLREHILLLQEELITARQRAEAAEVRCRDLERQVEGAEKQALAGLTEEPLHGGDRQEPEPERSRTDGHSEPREASQAEDGKTGLPAAPAVRGRLLRRRQRPATPKPELFTQPVPPGSLHDVASYNRMSANLAAEGLSAMNSDRALDILIRMQPTPAAAVLERMDMREAIGLLGAMTPSQVGALLNRADRTWAIDVIDRFEPTRITQMINELDAELTAYVLEDMSTSQLRGVLQSMDRKRAAEALDVIDPQELARAFSEYFRASRYARIFAELKASQAAQVLKHMDDISAGQLLRELPPIRVAAVLKLLPPELAAGFLRDLDANAAAEIRARMVGLSDYFDSAP